MIKTHSVYYPMYQNDDKFIILVTGGRSSGKAIRLSEVVATPWGFKEVRNLMEGEYICSVGGGVQKITQLHPIECREYVRVYFEDGTFNECSKEHLWEVYHNSKKEVKEAQFILKGEKIRLDCADFKWNKDCSVPEVVIEKDGRAIYKQPSEDFILKSRREGLFVRVFYYKGEKYAYQSNQKHKAIVKVESVGKKWGRCISVSDESGLFFISNFTVTHNSFMAGTFIERLTFEIGETEGKKIAHQILYTRYTMVSANISVIPEFLDKVEADGTSKYFYKTKTDVVNMTTGSRVMFRGIKTSSGNQTAKLKSIHGITTFVVDEAEEWTNEQEFDTIMLSIRQKGLRNRIIIIMNPTDSNHFIYKRYIKDTHRIEYFDGVPVQISTHPNVLHIHTSYLNNKEHCADNFLKEVEDMKINNPEKYAHIVMGQWADVAEGAIFKKWGIVKEFPKHAKLQGRGADWGYVLDASVGVKCGIIDNDLYIDELFYGTGKLSKELIGDFNAQDKDLFVYADSADQRLIDEIALGGVPIYPVQKGPGSIIAGIDKMLSFDNIYVTERSYHVQEELRNYTWDKDKDGNYINTPIDAYNHGIDAVRYYVLGKILGKVMHPKKINKDNLGIW